MLTLPVDLQFDDLVPGAVVHVVALEQVGSALDTEYEDYIADNFDLEGDIPVVMLRYRLSAAVSIAERQPPSLMPDVSFSSIDEDGVELASQASSSSVLESRDASSLMATAGPWPVLSASALLRLTLLAPLTDRVGAVLQIDLSRRAVTQV